MTDLLPPPTSVAADLCGDVVCETVAGRSALTRVWSTDPLRILSPSNNGLAKSVVLSSFGGGLLGGDDVAVRVAVKPAATLVVTTQSSGKVYRTESPVSSQSLEASVDDDALLAVLPDPLCAFAESRFHQKQRFEISASGNLVWLDWLTSGRHGRGERWAMSEIVSRTQINVAGRPIVRETLSLDAAAGEIGSMMRVGRFDCYAVLAAVGPMLDALQKHAAAVVLEIDVGARMPLLAADASLPGGRIFRILGPDVQTVGALIRRMLTPLHDLIGHDPWGRKW